MNTAKRNPTLGQPDIYRQIVKHYPETPYYVNVDADVVYPRDWITFAAMSYGQKRQ